MCPDVITKRVGEVEFIGIGKLNDYRLTFNRQGTFRQGGVASVVPVEDSFVYGIVWKLDEKQIRTLDAIENMAAYGRHTHTIDIKGAGLRECHCYITYPKGDFIPSRAYLDIITNAAKYHALPDDYIAMLTALQAADYPDNT